MSRPTIGHPVRDGGVYRSRPPFWPCSAPLLCVAVMMVLDGFAGMMWNIAQVSYRQRHIPAPLLGRVNSAFRFIGTGPAAFGAFAFGALVAWAESFAIEAVTQVQKRCCCPMPLPQSLGRC